MIAEVLAISIVLSLPDYPSDPTLFERRLSEKSYLLNANGCDEKDVRAAYQLEKIYGYENPCRVNEDPAALQSSHRDAL